MTGRRFAAVGLLGAAATGGLAALQAPRRLGWTGRLAVTTGVIVLFVRDAGMVAGGTPSRLKRVPGALLCLELTTAGLASLLGTAALVRGSGPPADDVGPTRKADLRLDRAADCSSTLTFALHALRQAVYLTPGQGRLETGTTTAKDGRS
ncbi:MAG TPA: hypothetical protein VMH50_14285 [Thermoleophilia bacterium]|nr:hypothetical protein [Thermoleophilia bacterium]